MAHISGDAALEQSAEVQSPGEAREHAARANSTKASHKNTRILTELE